MLQDLAALATALAVFIAVSQLWESRKLARAQFEDGLTTQYRALLAELPLDALLGRELAPAELEVSLGTFYRYFDLSNEQAYLRRQKRVSKKTWANWLEGIQQNMGRRAFHQAWDKLLPDLDGSFDDLKAILATPPIGIASLGRPQRIASEAP